MEIIGLIFGLLMGYVFFNSEPQKIIEDFKNPTCLEKKVGKDTVKKCYEIKEIK